MSEDSLNDKRNKILLLKNEISEISEEIKEKKIQVDKKNRRLEKLMLQLYKEYFTAEREEFALLTNIPSNTYNSFSKNYKHVLYDYSLLNVDVIGKIICDLIKKYDNEDFISKKGNFVHTEDTYFGPKTRSIPALIIGKGEIPDTVLSDEDYDIIISLNGVHHPVVVEASRNDYGKLDYAFLMDYHDGLSFYYPSNKQYIEELIYSLAYYQREHDIKYMMPEDTWNVYKKIYKK